MDKKNIEQWKPVMGYNGLYEVSNLGRIKSVERTRKSKGSSTCRVRERILKPTKDKDGDQHLRVTLSKNGVEKTYGVHVLVALAFPEICGEPFEGAQCNHIDENPLRNVPENLNWLSRPDNCNHGTRNERIAKANTNGKLSKTVYQYTKDTHELVGEYPSANEIERQTGWSQGHISECCLGKRKSAYNYVWSYERL